MPIHALLISFEISLQDDDEVDTSPKIKECSTP